MRDFLNAILLVIDAVTLTDDEYLAVQNVATESYSVETYGALLGILDARESISQTRDRLRYFFLAKGVAVSVVSTAKSNIFLGVTLED